MVAKGVLIARPFREGKNFSTKYFLNSEWLRRMRPKTSIKNCQEETHKFRLIRGTSNNDQNNTNSAQYLCPNLEALIAKIYFSYQTSSETQNIALHVTILKRLIFALTSRVTTEINRLLRVYGLDKIVLQLSADTFQDVEYLSLDPKKQSFLCEKLLDFMLIKKEQIFGKTLEKQGKKKLFTSFRYQRMAFVLNVILREKAMLMNDLLLLIKSELEVNRSYEIDKKTLFRILKDLEDIQLLKLAQYRIDFEESDGESAEQFPHSMNKLFVLDIEAGVNEEDIASGQAFRERISNSLQRVHMIAGPAGEADQETAGMQVENAEEAERQMVQLRKMTKLNEVFDRHCLSRSLKEFLKQVVLLRAEQQCLTSSSVFETKKKDVQFEEVEQLFKKLGITRSVQKTSAELTAGAELRGAIGYGIEQAVNCAKTLQQTVWLYRDCTQSKIENCEIAVRRALFSGLWTQLDELSFKMNHRLAFWVVLKSLQLKGKLQCKNDAGNALLCLK